MLWRKISIHRSERFPSLTLILLLKYTEIHLCTLLLLLHRYHLCMRHLLYDRTLIHHLCSLHMIWWGDHAMLSGWLWTRTTAIKRVLIHLISTTPLHPIPGWGSIRIPSTKFVFLHVTHRLIWWGWWGWASWGSGFSLHLRLLLLEYLICSLRQLICNRLSRLLYYHIVLEKGTTTLKVVVLRVWGRVPVFGNRSSSNWEHVLLRVEGTLRWLAQTLIRWLMLQRKGVHNF